MNPLEILVICLVLYEQRDYESTSPRNSYPPLGVEVISEFQEFQESFKSLKLHKVFSKDEDGSRKSKDGKCSIVVHLFCFELNLLMLNRFCSSNV